MANSLRAKLSKLKHDGNITEAEYQTLVKKLDGHDKILREQMIMEFAEKLKKDFMDYDLYLIFHANNLLKPEDSIKTYKCMVDDFAEELLNKYE